jgi:hypothetical protein
MTQSHGKTSKYKSNGDGASRVGAPS